MSVESVLDDMARVHFGEWLDAVRKLLPHVLPSDMDVSYNQLPDTERAVRREVMRPVLTVVIRAVDDEVLVDVMNAGDIEMHHAADLSQRLDQWLDS